MVNEELTSQPALAPNGTVTFVITRIGRATIYPKEHPDLLDFATIDAFRD